MRKSLIQALHKMMLATLLLASTADATQGPDIYTMNPDGSDVRPLTTLTDDNSAFWEHWSPDGKQIVFSESPAPDFFGQRIAGAYAVSRSLCVKYSPPSIFQPYCCRVGARE
jgi:hypothetical protein